MIDKTYISKYFETIKNQNDINLKDKLSWGFYFSHNKKELLDNLINNKFFNIYDFKEIIYCDNTYYLQISKNEVHTMESLLKRCYELYQFSKEFGIDSFEGFDVEET